MKATITKMNLEYKCKTFADIKIFNCFEFDECLLIKIGTSIAYDLSWGKI